MTSVSESFWLGRTSCLLALAAMAAAAAGMAGCDSRAVIAHDHDDTAVSKAIAELQKTNAEAAQKRQIQLQRQELRDLVVKLHESTLSATGVRADGDTAARSWVYFQAVRKLAEEIPEQVSLVDFLILANFAFAHSDLDLAHDYIDRAVKKIEAAPKSVTSCYAYNALGHLHFRHFPKSDLEHARRFYQQALDLAAEMKNEKIYFVTSSIRQEWALDEYSVGNEKQGDEQAKLAREQMGTDALPESYRSTWLKGLQESIVEAKVRGGLL